MNSKLAAFFGGIYLWVKIIGIGILILFCIFFACSFVFAPFCPPDIVPHMPPHFPTPPPAPGGGDMANH